MRQEIFSGTRAAGEEIEFSRPTAEVGRREREETGRERSLSVKPLKRAKGSHHKKYVKRKRNIISLMKMFRRAALSGLIYGAIMEIGRSITPCSTVDGRTRSPGVWRGR